MPLSKPRLCLLIASLMLCGCASSPLQLPRQIPPLDFSLAQPCQPLPDFTGTGYDEMQDWVQQTVLQLYGTCAARHAAAVRAWPH